jgi:glutathione peroxidase
MMKALYFVFFLLLKTNLIFAGNMSQINAHSFSFKDADGKDINLRDYQGKIILIVNTASKCGFTPQYQQLQQLHEDYKDKDLVVIAVPSNDFGKQEPANNQEIQNFTKENFNVTFLVTSKEKVKGKERHPFYQWAAKEVSFIGTPKWNFHKYLISQNGEIISWYSSATSPTNKKLIKKIDTLLSK